MTSQPQQNAVFPRSHVGFDSITSQIEKKLLKRGFQFNVICVGRIDQVRVSSKSADKMHRSNGPGKVDADQHHLRFAPDRLQGSSDP